jgi:hypothetical protein
MRGRRAAALSVVALVSVAAVIVIAAGIATPGYDATVRTVSRLATDRMPYAIVVDAAMLAVAAACVLLAAVVDPSANGARAALAAAACGFVISALIPLDDSSTTSTWTHRAASGLAMLSLTAAAAAVGSRYGAVSRVALSVELGLLVIALGLLFTPFAIWGAWERAALAVPLAWMAIVAFKIASTDETASIASAAASSGRL